MKWANRHSMDSRAIPLLKFCSSVEFISDHPYLKLNTKVRASMKDTKYEK